jgi:hypothetical protein
MIPAPVRGECNDLWFLDDDEGEPFPAGVRWLRCSLPPEHEGLHCGVIPGTYDPWHPGPLRCCWGTKDEVEA